MPRSLDSTDPSWAMRARPVHRLTAVDHDRTGAPADQAEDRFEGGRPAGAVRREGDHLAGYRHVDAVQDVRLRLERARRSGRRNRCVRPPPWGHQLSWVARRRCIHERLQFGLRAAHVASSTWVLEPLVGPSAITWPRCSTVIVSAILDTSCVLTIRIVGWRNLPDQTVTRSRPRGPSCAARRAASVRAQRQRGGNLQRPCARTAADVTYRRTRAVPTVRAFEGAGR